MTIEVDKKLFAAAVKALKLNVPVYSAYMEGKTVVILTRNGEQRWKPPAKKKPKAPAKKVTTPRTPGAAAKKTGVKK